MYSICSRTGQKSPLTGTAGRKAVIYSWAILKKKALLRFTIKHLSVQGRKHYLTKA